MTNPNLDAQIARLVFGDTIEMVPEGAEIAGAHYGGQFYPSPKIGTLAELVDGVYRPIPPYSTDATRLDYAMEEFVVKHNGHILISALSDEVEGFYFIARASTTNRMRIRHAKDTSLEAAVCAAIVAALSEESEQ